MKIINATGNYDRIAFIKGTPDQQAYQRGLDVRQQVGGSHSSSAIVNLSDLSREMQIAKLAVAQAEDTRLERIGQIKQTYAEGRYEVDAPKVAEKIIGSIMDRYA